MNSLFAAATCCIFFSVGEIAIAAELPAITQSKPELTKTEHESWQNLIGKWYGKNLVKEGGTREHLIERQPNGKYLTTFKYTKPDGSIEFTTEVGLWGVSGNVYFTIFRGWIVREKLRPSDPTDPYNNDAYQIIKLTKDVFEYQSVSTGSHYLVKRVSQDFAFSSTGAALQ